MSSEIDWDRLEQERRQKLGLPAFTIEDFYAHLPDHRYIFAPTGAIWTMAGVNAQLPKVGLLKATTVIDRDRKVQQMTWSPGDNQLIHNRLIHEGGWLPHPGACIFNSYRPPPRITGDAYDAEPWLAHVRKVYPDDPDHIIRWCAQRLQEPHVKINHALVLGGAPGIGKDSLLAPVVNAVGQWNCAEISPTMAMGRFNGFLKSVILRISEARDLGEVSRFAFYDHLKAFIAAPPDVLRIDEKHKPEHSIFNCCGVVITTNHKTDGIFLPADDRRHYVAWSPRQQTDFQDGYWNTLWSWYHNGGFENVAALLQQMDLSSFDPKAPPAKTAAFWDIVEATRSSEDAELADLFDYLGHPDATTLALLIAAADLASNPAHVWLSDRKNRRPIPFRLERAGYTPVRNPDADDGLWKLNNRRQVAYARSTLSLQDQLRAAKKLGQCDQ